MKRLLTTILLCTALLCGGCFKKVTTDTTAVIKTSLQEKDKGEYLPLAGVDVYAYYNCTEQWTVASYDDAVARRITDTASGEVRTEPDAVGVPYTKYGTGNYTSVELRGAVAMVVVVDPTSKMYARMYKAMTAENLPETFLTLIFHAWKSEAYTEGKKEGFKWYVSAPAEPYNPVPEEGETPEDGDDSTEGGTTEDTTDQTM